MINNYDYHMHTSVSYDADIDINLMIEKAIKIGYMEIAISEHLELDFETKDIIDYKEYIENFKALQNKYKNDIKLILASELGFTEKTMPRIKQYLNPYSFDFIILSIHSMYSTNDIYSNNYFDGKTKEDAYNLYFEKMIEYASQVEQFSVFGHLDYIARYGMYDDLSLKFDDYKDVLTRLIEIAIKNKKGFEINTAYLRKNNFSFQFYKDFFKAYKEAGGEILTLGSDSHHTISYRLNYDLAKEILKFAGFDYISTFENMQAKKVYIN